MKRSSKNSWLPKPQLELDLSGDRAIAILEECAARDADARDRARRRAEDEAARARVLLSGAED